MFILQQEHPALHILKMVVDNINISERMIFEEYPINKKRMKTKVPFPHGGFHSRRYVTTLL
jgi:hypothetical protein